MDIASNSNWDYIFLSYVRQGQSKVACSTVMVRHQVCQFESCVIKMLFNFFQFALEYG